MDLAYLDKLPNDKTGVEYLLVRQALIDRTVDATGKKRKDCKETVCAFLTMTTKKNRPTKTLTDKGTEPPGDFKKLSKAERIEIYFEAQAGNIITTG